MQSKDAKQEFIEAWGNLGSSWGTNRTMSSIHALLMTSNKPMSTEDIMAELKISRGNANMNIRSLIDWGLVRKRHIAGERKEFFEAEKDIWEIAKQISRERRKREIKPVIDLLGRLKEEEDGSDPEFSKLLSEMHDFTSQMSGLLDKFNRNDRSWFSRTLLKLLK